ncbi:MAG: Mrp/NBP35 family ATP-binding protein [Thermoplasmatota archaeon]|jgi:ATP-binding protein involved in chromosome partitioning
MNKENTKELKVTTTLDNIRHKIIVLSGKGGVGKSTISVNLALLLSQKGYKVGLLDGDIHGPSVPKILGVENQKPHFSQEGVIPVSATSNLKIMSMAFLLPDKDSPIIWRGPMKMGALKQFIKDVNWGHLDYLIVDLPPGTGDEPLSIAQLIPDSDGAIIVTTPQDVALLSVRKSVNFVKKMNIPVIGIIENMSGFTCPHCKTNTDIFKTGGGIKASKDFNIPFLGKIPIDPQIVKMGDEGKNFMFNDKSTTTILFKEIVEKIEKKISEKR